MKTLILLHGRGFKPSKARLKKLWLDALRFGVARDFPAALDQFDAARIEFVYYGDISNAFLSALHGDPVPEDFATRRATLDGLMAWKQSQFDKATYEGLAGQESYKEGLADIFSAFLSFTHLGDEVISLVAPDMKEYWMGYQSPFGSAVRAPVTRPLKQAFNRGDSVCIIAHSLGSLIAYDVLWKFSYMSEYRPDYCSKLVDVFLTVGSPLGDDTVKRGLFGASATNERQFPCNIRKWVNIAAEDDFICHDKRIKNDYRDMLKWNLIDAIEDHRIYNLSLRNGKSNPHHSTGYLIHPTLTKVLVDWLSV